MRTFASSRALAALAAAALAAGWLAAAPQASAQPAPRAPATQQNDGPFADVVERFPECASLAADYRQLDTELRAAAAARPRSATAFNRLSAARSETLARLTACTRQGTRARAEWRLDTAGFQAIAASADGRAIVTADAQSRLWIWSAVSGRASSVLLEQQPLAVAITPDGERIFVAYRLGAELRDTRTHEVVVEYSVLGNPAPVLSRDGQRLLARSRDGDAIWLDVATGRELGRFPLDAAPRALALSADGRVAYASTGQGAAAVWSLDGSRAAMRWQAPSGARESAVLTRDGAFVLSATAVGPIEIRSTSDGRVLRTLGAAAGSAQMTQALAIDGADALLASAHRDGKVRLWSGADGSLVRELDVGGSATAAEFSADGQVLYAGGPDTPAHLWNAGSGTLLAELVAMRDGNWAVIDDAGRYDAPPGAALDGLELLIRRQSLSLAQIKETAWDPGLLAKRLGWNPEPLRPIADIENLAPSPLVAIEAPTAAGAATLTLDDQGGGIGRVRVLVNGKEIDAPSAVVDGRVALDLSNAPVRPGEINTLEATVWNSAGDLASRGTTVTWLAPGEKPTALPELYAIVVGISEYASSDLRLRFAAADAAAVATAIERGATRLLGRERVHVTLLTSDGTERPDKARIRAAFDAAARARPDDVLFVYLAGHGVVSGDDTYAYLTADARSLFQVDAAASVTSVELVDWIKRSKALKQVMVLDTCAAGAIADELLSARGVPGDQIRAIERLQSRTGFHVLMGSAADRLSYEATQFGRGLLTHALLQGLYGPALRDGEYMDVSRWFQYALDEVPALARQLGGVQQPLVAAPRGSSFDLGRLTAEDRAAIPLPSARPLVLRPVFLDPERGFDHLELMSAVRERLLDASAPSTRGAEFARSAVYVDADELPGAVRLSGTYSLRGDAVTVAVNLIRDGTRIGGYEVGGTRGGGAALADEIAAEAQRALAALPAAR
jgi:hypothetical protein